MSSHQYRKVREQWKTETDMRLPTSRQLGVKNVGNGILGDTKDSEGYNRSLQYEREPVRIRRMTDTKDRSGTKELKSYGRKKLPLCEAASVFLLFCREFWGKA